MKILQIPVAFNYLNLFVTSSGKENIPSLIWPPHNQWIFTGDVVVNILCMHQSKGLVWSLWTFSFGFENNREQLYAAEIY